MKLPLLLKIGAVNLQGFLNDRVRYGRVFKGYLDYLISVDMQEQQKLDREKLECILVENEFYRDNPDYSVDFEHFPIIDKSVVKANYEQIKNKDEAFSSLKTSGTTGGGLVYPVSKEFISKQWAVFWKFRLNHGLSLQSKCAAFTGRLLIKQDRIKPPFAIYSFFSRQLLLSQYHLNADSVEWYLNSISKRTIQWLHGYPSTLSLFAHLIIEKGLMSKATSLNLKVITTSSEKLLDYQKRRIEEVFGCSVRELYGLTEGVVNIFECPHGMLHVDETYSYVEFHKTEDPEYYRIVGTLLSNKAFPLIRYDTGDRVSLYPPSFKCSCGRKSRIVKEIHGRQEDYLSLKNGNQIGRLDRLFKGITSIIEAQIIQEQEGKAQFLIVYNKDSSNDERTLIQNIRNHLGKDFDFQLNKVASIPKTKSGKLKFVVNKIS